MTLKNVHDLMTTAMTYVLDFEEQIGEAAPKMAAAASAPDLKDLFSKTQSKSKEYAQRVEDTFSKLNEPVKRNSNAIATAMLHEVHEMIGNTDAGPVRDAALIVAANQQQLFRVASYGSLESYAKLIGKESAVGSLRETLEDSKTGDKKFTQIAESNVNQQAAEAA